MSENVRLDAVLLSVTVAMLSNAPPGNMPNPASDPN
jgi:hypothetical protein